ncbi:MAG: LamG-like jellyroll fold domain-containing protein [Gemmatimonadota bacterium]
MSEHELTRRTVLRRTALGILGATALPAAETVLAPAARAATAPLALTVDAAHPGHAVSPDLYGVFFEEINYGGVGGIYPELIRNRAFMDPATPAQWIAPGDIPRVPGKFGSALQLNGGSPAQYVALPQGIVSGLTDFTVAAWVNPAALPTWSRVFDFGDGENIYMFMTVAAGGTGNPRFAITVSSNGHEQQLNAPSPIPANAWSHLAVTLSGTTATLYVNGSAVDTNTSMTLNPTSLGATTQNYLGKSQWPDPYLDATLDEVQIYSRALSAAEVQSLTTSAGGTPGGGDVAWYRFDEAKGDVATDSSGHSRDGTIVPVTTDWNPVQDGGGSVTASLDAGAPLNSQLSRSLRLDMNSAAAGQRAGMANGGYFGVPVVPGRSYRVSFFAKASDFTGPLTVSLEAADGSKAFASARVGGLTTAWRRYTTTLRVPAGASESTGNRFVIGIDNRTGPVTPVPAGTSVWLQVVSVFPPTYRNRPNGLRPDLVELLRRIRPKILRFPGGNYLEGGTVATRFDWKTTIGPIWERPGHQNSAWGYWSDDGLGLLEFLQLAEDLGATPVLGVWAGYALNGTVIAQSDLGPYVQDALDEIEYAIGPVTSRWGARRAADGHPAPFPVPYIEIGNEDQFDRSGSYGAYRYPMFYDAIKAAYPQIKTIATTPVTSRPMDIIDEHYYSSAAFFEQQSTRYDSYDRNGPMVFVGEYAATAGAGGLPTGLLGNSIGEAAFMTGMERNSDIVHMSSYAPLFANVGHTQWNPDLIGYDQIHSFGSTSYWVQRMFARNVGDKVLPVTASATGLYFSATIGSRTGAVYLKIVNPGSQAVPTQLTFAGRSTPVASLQVLSDPDPQAGNTLANPTAVVPARGTLRGSKGVFSYQAPANSLTVVTLGS